MTHPGDLLSGYLDGELTASELAPVARHVAGCAQCAAELDAAVAARAALRSLPMLEPPVALLGTGEASVVDLTARRSHRIARWAAAVAASVAIVAGVAIAGGEPAPTLDLGTMSANHTARVIVDPGIATIRGPVSGP